MKDLITVEDVKDLAYMKGSELDMLAAVVLRAKQIYEAAQPPPSSAAHGGGSGEVSSSKERKRNSHDGSGEASSSPASKKTKKKCNPRSEQSPPPPPPPPPLPQEYERVIQDHAAGRSVTALRLVIQKELFATDVATHHNRLSIPIRQIRDDFLTAEERREVAEKRSKEEPFEVEMLTPSLEWEKGVNFNKWDMPKDNGSKMSSSYVIIGAWNEVVRKNGLRKGMEVQLWSFRVDQDLGFALVRLN